MKFLNFVIIVGLGVVFFSLMGGKLRLPAALQEVNDMLDPQGRKAAVQVDTSEAKPQVHVKNLLRVRGKVMAIHGNAALVDCDAQAKLSKNALTQINQSRLEDGDTGRTNYAALVQAEADREAFGELKVMDERDNLVLCKYPPSGQQPRGKVLLRGLPVRVGDVVHVVTMSLGTDHSGVPVHTARFAVQGGAWMWRDGGRTLLDSQGRCDPAPPVPRSPSAP